MPPTRRRSGNANASNQQPTLSFKGTQSRITKPTATPLSAKDPTAKPPLQTTTSAPKFSTAKDLLRTAREGYTIPPAASASASASPSSEKDSEPSPKQETTTLPHHSKPQPQQKPKHLLTPTETTALSLTPQDLEEYWSSLESTRKAARVHQSTTSTNEKILRHFDLSSEYGPCIGLSRMERWKRAERLGLKPEVEVLGVLLREEGEGGGSRIDELLA